MTTPEPCLKARCHSPTACNGWGYCRERNSGDATQAEREALVPERRALADRRRLGERP